MSIRRRPRLALRTLVLEDRAVPATLNTFLTNFHVDMSMGYTAGNLTLAAHDDTNAITHSLDNALHYVSPVQSVATRPAASEFAFVGVGAGQPYYLLPQSSDPDLLFMGIAADVPANTFASYDPTAESKGRLTASQPYLKLSLTNIVGPGSFAIWQNGETEPRPFISSFNDGTSNPNGNGLDTTDGVSADDAVWIIAGGHNHFNWGFSAPGRYELTFTIRGKLQSTGNFIESAPITAYFSVGSVGRIDFASATATVNETTSTANVTVQRTGGSDGRLTVQYATTNGSAIAGSDYTSASGTLTFEDGETSKVISIPITNDTDEEGDETINLSLTNVGPATIADYVVAKDNSNLLGTTTSAVLTILDDDSSNTRPTISDILDANTDEDTATGNIPFTVGDIETPVADLVLSVISSNQVLVPNANITFGGSGASRTINVQPVSNLSGQSTITVSVTDANGKTTTDSFVLTVDPVNDVPTANNLSRSTRPSRPVGVTLTGSDIDLDPLTFVVQTGPANGVLSGTGANLTYTPNLGFAGEDTFTYVANDGLADSAAATVTITVGGTNVNPVAVGDAFVVGRTSSVRGNVLFNDTDADADPLLAAKVADPNHGTLTFNVDGTFVYTPGATFTGSDSFTYTAGDGLGSSAVTTVTITGATPQAFTGVLREDHTDVGIAYADGAWDLHVHAEEGDAEFEPGEGLLYVGPQAERPRPAGSQFDFLGVAAGDPIWQLRHSDPNAPAGLLELGFGAEELATGLFVNDQVRLKLKAVNGPGQFSVWRTGQTGPEVIMATADGITSGDFFDADAGNHADLNWGFTARGRYEVTFEATGTLAAGNIVTSSGDVTYYFSVDNTGKVEFTPANVLLVEGKTATITVTRTGGSDGPAIVAYSTTPGTATTADYFAATGSLAFADGEDTKTFTFRTRADTRREIGETATIGLTVPSGSFAELGTDSTAAITIDDSAPLRVASVRFNDGAVQRSNLEQIAIKFSRDTNIAALIQSGEILNAIRIVQINGTVETPVDLTGRFFYSAATNTVFIGLTTSSTNNGLSNQHSTILANGRYELRLSTNLISTEAGGLKLLDTDRVRTDSTYRSAFHRLEGDLNGDRRLTTADSNLLKARRNTFSWQSRYLYAYDLNHDGVIDNLDVTYFTNLTQRTI